MYNNQRKKLENENAKIVSKVNILEMDSQSSFSKIRTKMAKMEDFNTVKSFVETQVEESEFSTQRIVTKRNEGKIFKNLHSGKYRSWKENRENSGKTVFCKIIWSDQMRNIKNFQNFDSK